MKNFYKLFGIIALVAVIGFSMVSCEVEDEEGPAPSVPANVSAAPLSEGDLPIRISWDRQQDITGYYIYRSTSETGPFTQIGEKNNDSFSSWIDTTVELKTTYWYKVASYNSYGRSPQSDACSITTISLGKPKIDHTRTRDNRTNDSITIYFDLSAGATGYKIHRKLVGAGDESYILVAEITDLTVTSYTDTGLTANTDYVYRLTVYNNEEEKSDIIIIRTTEGGGTNPVGNGTENNPYQLTSFTWVSGTYNAMGSNVWYSFNATGNNDTYYVQISSSRDKTVSVYYPAGQGSPSFPHLVSANQPLVINYPIAGTLKLKIGGESGTFSIRYTF